MPATTSVASLASPVSMDAFHPVAMDGYAMEMWRVQENLIASDCLFALGFASYSLYLNHVRKHQGCDLDVARELLIRLYICEPRFPHLFHSPSIAECLDYLFNLPKSTAQTDHRRTCAPLLAQILGRNRVTGYRWLRSLQHSQNFVSVPIRRIFCKIFSMDSETARTTFWRAAFATAHARGQSTDLIKERLLKNGVLL